MCIVSNIGDGWGKTIPGRYPWIQPQPVNPDINIVPNTTWLMAPTREEFNKLKAEVEALRQLLIQAKAFDEATQQANCTDEEKVGLIRRIAELVGVDISEVFDTERD